MNLNERNRDHDRKNGENIVGEKTLRRLSIVNLAQVTQADLLAGQDRAVDVEMIKLLRDVPAHIELEQIQHTSVHEIDIRITRVQGLACQ